MGTTRPGRWWFLYTDTNTALFRDWLHPNLFLTFADSSGKLFGPIAYPGTIQSLGIKLGMGLRIGISILSKEQLPASFDSIPERFTVCSSSDFSALIFVQRMLIGKRDLPLQSFGLGLPFGPFGFSYGKFCGAFHRQSFIDPVPADVYALPWLRFFVLWVLVLAGMWWIFTHAAYNLVEFIIPLDQLWIANGLPLPEEEVEVLSDCFRWCSGSSDANPNIPDQLFEYYDTNHDGTLTEAELGHFLDHLIWLYHEKVLAELVQPILDRYVSPILGWRDPRALELARLSLRTSLLLTHDRMLNNNLVASTVGPTTKRPLTKTEFSEFLIGLKNMNYFEQLRREIFYSIWFPNNSNRPPILNTVSLLDPKQLTVVNWKAPDPDTGVVMIEATTSPLVPGGSARRVVFPVMIKIESKPDQNVPPFQEIPIPTQQ